MVSSTRKFRQGLYRMVNQGIIPEPCFSGEESGWDKVYIGIMHASSEALAELLNIGTVSDEEFKAKYLKNLDDLEGEL